MVAMAVMIQAHGHHRGTYVRIFDIERVVRVRLGQEENWHIHSLPPVAVNVFIPVGISERRYRAPVTAVA